MAHTAEKLNKLPVSEQRIDAHRRFVQNEQLRFVKKGDGERDASLLSATQRFHVTMTRRKIQQFRQKFQLRIDKIRLQIVDATEIVKRFLDAKIIE